MIGACGEVTASSSAGALPTLVARARGRLAPPAAAGGARAAAAGLAARAAIRGSRALAAAAAAAGRRPAPRRLALAC